MNTPQQKDDPPLGVEVDDMRIERRDGQLVLLHSKFIEPIEVPEAQLARWLRKQIREQVKL